MFGNATALTTQAGGQPISSISKPAAYVRPAPAPAPIMNPYTDVRMLFDPYGGNAGFLEENSLFNNGEDELKRLRDEI
jgi:hypothetical protein